MIKQITYWLAGYNVIAFGREPANSFKKLGVQPATSFTKKLTFYTCHFEGSVICVFDAPVYTRKVRRCQFVAGLVFGWTAGWLYQGGGGRANTYKYQ